DDMAAVFGDRLRAARAAGHVASARFWVRTVVDVARHGLAERQAARRARVTGERGALLRALGQDVRSAARVFRQRRVFVATALVTLAIGIGSASAVFSVTNALVLKPLPFPAPDRLVDMSSLMPTEEEFARLSPIFETHAYWVREAANLVAAGSASRGYAALTSPAFFELTGMRPIAGRLFTESEASRGADPGILLDERSAVEMYHSPAAALGQIVRLNG